MKYNCAFAMASMIAMMILVSTINGFKPISNCRSNAYFRCEDPLVKSKIVSRTKLNMDATVIPMVIGATGLIFAVFSFDNKIDLTDSGMAKAKALRYNARKERGEIPSKEVLANADPYRWFADEDEEVDILTPKKKKGGGCG